MVQEGGSPRLFTKEYGYAASDHMGTKSFGGAISSLASDDTDGMCSLKDLVGDQSGWLSIS